MQGGMDWNGNGITGRFRGNRTAANVLTKWMNEYRLDFLLENHIRYDFCRKNSHRLIFLARQEDTDGDGRDDGDGVSGIPPAAATVT